MEPHVRTRWTEDGLVEIRVDAVTAKAVLEDLGRSSGVITVKLYESLGHTLAVNEKPPVVPPITPPKGA